MVHLILFGTVIIAFMIRKSGRKIQFLPFLILLSFAAMRYMYGNDYYNYLYRYEIIKSGGKSTYDEILFYLLNKVCSNFYILIAITSFILILTVYFLIKNNVKSKYVWMSIAIFVINPYLFLMNLSAIRQSLAMVLFIIAIQFAIDRKMMQYFIIILLATLFHKSAIVLLPIYFIANDKTINKKTIYLVLLFVVLLLTTSSLQNAVNQVVVWFDDLNYRHYLQNDTGNSLRATLLTSVYFVYILGNIKNLKDKELVYSKLYLVSSIFGILAFKLSMLTRIQMYFEIFSIVALPMIYQKNPMNFCFKIKPSQPLKSLWKVVNQFVLPIMIMIILVLRYISFFSNPMWKAFEEYRSILELL